MAKDKHPIIETLTKHCQSGDSCVNESILYKKFCAEHPSVEYQVFVEELKKLDDTGELHLDGEFVYLRQTWEDEEYSARRLAEFLQRAPHTGEPLPKTIKAGELTLCEEQRNAVAMVSEYDLSAIIGGAGSGKSATACAAIEALNVSAEEIVLCAPTGRAARNLCDATGYPAITLHRALHVSYDGSVQSADALEGKKLVVVDEAGMMPLRLFAALLRAAPQDCRIILLGDENQLQGIGSGNVLSDLLELEIPHQKLLTLHRQQDISSALYYNVSNFAQINSVEKLHTDGSFQLRTGTDDKLRTMLIAEAVDRYRVGESVRVISPRRSGVPFATQELNTLIREELNPLHEDTKTLQYGKTQFRDKDMVMVTANDPARGCFNGDIGMLRIWETEKSARYYVLFPDGSRTFWTKGELEKKRLPLEHAYAATVHKAQGSGYDTVLLPLSLNQMSNMLTRNLLYTAISRAKRRVIIFGTEEAVEKALLTKPSPRFSKLVEKMEQHMLQGSLPEPHCHRDQRPRFHRNADANAYIQIGA